MARIRGLGQTQIKVIGLGFKREFDELSLSEFLKSWSAVAPADKSPPWAVLVSEGEVLKIGMVTEYWNRVGGPQPYSDSYTYAIYSEHEVFEGILKHLRAANVSERWFLDLPVIKVPADKVRMPPTAPGKLEPFFLKLRTLLSPKFR